MKANVVSQNNSDWSIHPLNDSNGIFWFSSDDVIDAYFKGKQAGKQEQIEENKQIFFEKIEENLKTAYATCENVFNELNKNGSVCDHVYLKIKNIVNFDAIFVVAEEEWCKDEFDQYYAYNQNLLDEINNDTFKLSLIFMPKTQKLDSIFLQSDGYIFSYPQ